MRYANAVCWIVMVVALLVLLRIVILQKHYIRKQTDGMKVLADSYKAQARDNEYLHLRLEEYVNHSSSVDEIDIDYVMKSLGVKGED